MCYNGKKFFVELRSLKFDNTYATIYLDAISANFQAIREKAGTPVMAVVKADAYGHGAIQVARHLQNVCAFFGVSSMQEAMELREAGLSKPILILGHTRPEVFPEAIQLGIRPTIFCAEDGEKLSEAAVALGVTAAFHFAVDTGMGRIGFQPTEADADICAAIAKLPNLQPEGLFSHFATADSQDLSFAHIQLQRFARFAQMLRDRAVSIPLLHMDNSAGIMNFDRHFDMVRAGIVIYGMYPSDQVDPGLLSLTPALSWHSRVSHVKTLEPGCPISYGGTFVTNRKTVVATVPAGYADGYRRSLSNRFHVLIRGKKAPILGRICMDQMMVDVTDIPGVCVGDPVTLIGTDGENTITMEQIADQAGSFHYEFACGISRRVPRRYLQDGKVVQEIHYLLDH